MNSRQLRSVRSITVAAPIRALGASPVTRLVRKLALAALILVATASSHASDIGTAFTYQGFLEKPAGTAVGTPAPVNCDFEFTLWDDAEPSSMGIQIGPTLTFAGLDAVEVTDGVFTVLLDFGANAINGQPRWLAIRVCCPSGCALEALYPRVELTPAPYSIRAGEGVGGPNALNVTPSGDVGIGTTTPATKLHVAVAGHDGVFVEGDDTGDARYSLENGGGPHFIFDDDSDAHALKIESAATRALAFNTSGPNERMRIDAAGNVGIGTTTPAARLDVNGAARTTTLEITGGLSNGQTLPGWGSNEFGQINVPKGAFTAVAAGAGHSLAIRDDGTLIGWGAAATWLDRGQTNVPTGTFTAVAAGYYHSLAIRSDGALVGFGGNDFGEINVPAGSFTAIAAGWYHSLAMRSDGTLAGWGSNFYGEINVPSGTFSAIAAGSLHSLALRDDGTLVGWGYNSYGQTDVPSGTFIAVAGGYEHSLAIRSDDTLVGWGKNNFGQTDVPAGTFTAIAAGDAHSLAIRTDGVLVSWGLNNYGQINVPLGTFSVVAAGGNYSLAIRRDQSSQFGLLLASDSAAKPGSNTWTIWSDRRLKKNIEPLSGALERLLQLRGVTFQWSDPASQGGITGTQMGLIADEVQRAFPQWVGRDPKGYQTLTVGGFEALTAEALRDLRAEKNLELSQKNVEIAELRQRLTKLEAILEKVTNNQREENR